MKRYYFLLMALLLLAACTKSETDTAAVQQLHNSPDFYATFESDDTRTFVDEKVRLLWTEGDQLSIFTSTLNQKYEFDGETGDNSGTFTPISSGQFGSGSSLSVDANFAVYPYNQSTKISYDGDLSIDLPSTQSYAEDSFGVNANTMVAATKSQNDYFLSFKNLGGFLKLQLYGDVTVKSIQLKGNNGEKIAGAATVVAKSGKNPTLTMSSTATDAITLDCGTGVKLGTSSSSATEFWIVVPPVTFTKGFTITITDTEGGTMTKSTSKSYTVERNVIKTMTAFKVETTDPNIPPANEIWYTSTDGNPIEIEPGYSIFNFGAYFVSNNYSNGQGVITFDRKISRIGEFTFRDCSSLSSIAIPESVTQIGYEAFYRCSSLTSINIPNGVTQIGNSAFSGCSTLSSITIPDGVTQIEYYTFRRCSSLTSIIIPEDVTKIWHCAFEGCSSLTSITIPEGVTQIMYSTFYGCSSLSSIDIPESVVKIENYTFFGCSSLTNITIPEGVNKIGSSAFEGCASLKSVELPNGTIIEDGAFSRCSSLTNVNIPDGVTIIADSPIFGGCSSLVAFSGKYASQDGRCLIVDGELNSFAPAGLTSYIIPKEVSVICQSVFSRYESLTSITIPESVTRITTNAFNRCTSLKEVYCKSATPPSLGKDVFNFNASKRKIYVPTESVEEYKAAHNWSSISSSIVGYDFE